jgi:PhzF family phenazine biosynthesis protein
MTEILRYSAFTLDGAGGNPAGVVLAAGDLDEEQMQALAADLGYSETAFLVPEPTGRNFAIRYFSPLAEVAFCGHATISGAVAVADRHGVGPLTLLSPVGPIAVETGWEGDEIVATLVSVPTWTAPAPPAVVDAALRALGWSADDLDARFPAHVANAGVNHLVLAAASRQRLADLDYDFSALARLMTEQKWTTVNLFWAESRAVFHARNPFPPGGMVEDPATGAAAAAFGGYLRALDLVRGPFTVYQGCDMGRPSRLLVDASADPTTVRVTGAAAPI